MEKQTILDTLGWGIILWLIGYVLGILLFFVVPAPLIGWVILPVGIILTLWVLLARIGKRDLRYYAFLALTWTAIAIACDYIFIVILFRPTEPYYKADVYVYYFLMVILPLAAGWWKRRAAPGS